MNHLKTPAILTMLLAAACSAPSDSETVGASDSDIRRCAGGETVAGIDVSEYQPTVDFDAVRASGRRFAFLRVSDGARHPDSAFPRHWPAAKAAGLLRGTYQYFRASQDALAQANLLVERVGKLGPGDLPAVLDIESADGASDSTIVAGMRVWLDRVEAGTGKRPIVYTSIGFYGDLSGGGAFADYPLWVANYGVTCPETPAPWSRWSFWQHAENGHVPGVSGNSDVNVWNGTFASLTAFAGGETKSYAPIEVYWARTASGAYELRALASPEVTRVEYVVDGYQIASALRGPGNFPTSYSFFEEGEARDFQIRGFDATGEQVARGNGLIDVTPDTAVFVKQLDADVYEIGLERAPAGVASISARADGDLLTDGVEGTTRATRLAIRSRLLTKGARAIELSTFDASGALRGTLRRTFQVN